MTDEIDLSLANKSLGLELDSQFWEIHSLRRSLDLLQMDFQHGLEMLVRWADDEFDAAEFLRECEQRLEEIDE